MPKFSQILVLGFTLGLVSGCASKSSSSKGAKPLVEAQLPIGAELRFDLGNGALKFFMAPLEVLPRDEFERTCAYGPLIVVRTDLGTRRQDFRSELSAWDWIDVVYNEEHGKLWAFLEYTVAGPGEVIAVVASFDRGITWQRLPDIPKPHHAARYKGFREIDAATVEVTLSLEADLVPERKNPKRLREFLFTAKGSDQGRREWALVR